MNTTSPFVQEFFDQYASSRSAQDIGLIASQYPDSFMFAGPKGARVAESRQFSQLSPKDGRSLNHWVTNRRRFCPWRKPESASITCWCGRFSYGVFKDHR